MLRDAIGLLAHAALYDRGLLHCDISGGNVMLSLDPQEQGAAGFITDFDYSFLRRGSEFLPHPTEGEHQSGLATDPMAPVDGEDIKRDRPITVSRINPCKSNSG